MFDKKLVRKFLIAFHMCKPKSDNDPIEIMRFSIQNLENLLKFLFRLKFYFLFLKPNLRMKL